MAESELRALVVGTGFGCRIQVPALRGAGFDVVGLVGSDAGRTAERAAANGVAQAYTDLDKAIAETDAQVVAISTPPHTHAPLSLQALSHGCHVLCEKPFARDGREAQAMLDAAQAAGKVHVIGNEFRFVPQRATVARAIAEGMIGKPHFASLVQIMGFVKEAEDEFPDWWFDPAEGGGWLGASGSHVVDQIRAWLGEFESVSASLDTVSLTRGPVDDSYSVRFRLRNGVEGIMQQTSGAYGPLTELTHIAGDKGRIWFDGPAVRFADSKGERELPVPGDLALPDPPPLTADPRHARPDWQAMAYVEIAPYTRLCEAMRAAILGAPSPSPVPVASFADGVANMKVMDAIRASAANGGELVKVEQA
ncbi:MAG: Gfo/Idh/MocA family oxidoreductase [Novosphingobium sp.]|nr:Gfo/Idh/MocA family oxidoreductase [Novosphingobium sp.]MCP5402925.1 Gfo/Idh/MocA family oxidoreductase [Novosphingobium sp.]